MNKSKNITKTAKAIILVGLFAMVLVPAIAAAQDDVIKWRLQSFGSSGGSDWEKSVVALRDKLYERTGGRLDIELHPAESLVGSSEIFPAVSRGVIEIGHTSPAYIMDYISTASLAWGPSSFRNVSEAAYFWKHLGFEDIIRREALEKHNIHYFTDLLYFTRLVLNKPVKTTEDFEALRIRAAGSLAKFIADSGAATAFISGSELYQSLSTGAVDGAHWGGAQNANDLSLYESAKYHASAVLGIANEIFIINDQALSSLPEDIQTTVRSTLEEHFWARTNQYEIEELEMLNQLASEKGVQTIDLPEEIVERMDKATHDFRHSEAKKSEYTAEAVERLEAYLGVLGYL